MKRIFIGICWIISFILLHPSANGKEVDFSKSNMAITFNVAETAGFLMAREIINWHYTLIPLHFDGSYMLTNKIGLGFGAVYRYENYGEKPTSGFGSVAPRELWTNYHELFLMTGPRFTFFGAGLHGGYAALKMGFGGALSPGGYAFTVVSQPEVGYSFALQENRGFFFDIAAGVLLNHPIAEAPKMGYDYTLVGWLVHRTIPMGRLGIGFYF